MLERPRRAAQISRATGSSPPADAGLAGVIVGRRGGRPGQRAVLGGLLVAAAAVVVFASALSSAGGHRSNYVVAARPLAAGSIIGPGDTVTARLGLSGASAVAAFRQGGALIGRTLAVSVGAGQLIQSSMLASASGTTLRPVSIPVDAVSLAALSPGESVNVLSAPSQAAGAGGGAGGASPSVTVVMRGATLISVSRPDGGLLSPSSTGTAVVTLGVSDLAEAEQLVQAAHAGTIELIQAVPADGTGLGGGSVFPSSGTGA